MTTGRRVALMAQKRLVFYIFLILVIEQYHHLWTIISKKTGQLVISIVSGGEYVVFGQFLFFEPAPEVHEGHLCMR